MASAEGKAPLTVQLAMASWVAPALASFANTFTKHAGEREPIVVIGTGVALVGAVLLGLLCGVAGLVAASRDPHHRVTLRRHSVAGLVISGVFSLLLLGGTVHTISERRANESAMRRFLQLPKTENLATLDAEGRYALIAAELRRASDTSRGDQKALFDAFADSAESLIEPMKQHHAAWRGFTAKGGVRVARVDVWTLGDRRRGARIRSGKGGSGVRGAVLATGRFLFRERSRTEGVTLSNLRVPGLRELQFEGSPRDVAATGLECVTQAVESRSPTSFEVCDHVHEMKPRCAVDFGFPVFPPRDGLWSDAKKLCELV